MKKSKKVKLLIGSVASAMALVTVSGALFVPSAANVYADDPDEVLYPWINAQTSYDYQATDIPTNGKVGEVVTFGAPAISGGTYTIVPVVKDAAGAVVAVEQEGAVYKFTPSESGTFTLYYSIKNGSSVEIAKTKAYYIDVEGSEFSLDFESNQKIVAADKTYYAMVPSKTSSEYPFVLPVATILNQNDMEVDANYNIKITNGGTTILDTSTSTKNETYIKEITGTLNGKNVKTYQVTAPEVSYVSSLNIEYFYKADGAYIATKNYSVKVVAPSKLKGAKEDDVSLSATLQGTGSATTAILGEEVVLKTPKVSNAKDSSQTVDFYTKMEVVHIKTDGSEESLAQVAGERTDISSTLKFTPTLWGEYRVYYSVVDVYGNTSETETWRITGNYGNGAVYDSKRPTITFAESYAVVDNVPEEAVEANYLVANTVVENDYTFADDYTVEKLRGKKYVAKITIPALYAEDNCTAYKDLNLQRLVYYKGDTSLTSVPGVSGKTITVKDVWESQNDGLVYPGENSVVEIYVEKLGDYQLCFTAGEDYVNYLGTTVANSKTYKYSDYNITVVGKDTEEATKVKEAKLPSITQNVTTSIDGGTKVYSFSTPTASSDIDTNLYVKTYYYFGSSAIAGLTNGATIADVESIIATNANIKEASHNTRPNVVGWEKTDSARFYVNVEDATASNLYVFTIASDYYNRSVDGGKYALVSNKIDLADVVVDSAAPAISQVSASPVDPSYAAHYADYAGYYSAVQVDFGTSQSNENTIINAHQDYNVYLPKVTFTDTSDYIQTSVRAYKVDDESGKVLASETPKNIVRTNVAGGVEVNGGVFVPSKKGKYLVEYLANDSHGNITAKTFELIVKGTHKPVINPTSIPSSVEIGESVDFYQAKITVDGEAVANPEDCVVTMSASTTEGVNPTSEGFNGKKFTPVEKGTYEFVYTYTYQGIVGTATVQIEVEDTKGPTFTQKSLTEIQRLVNAVDSGVAASHTTTAGTIATHLEYADASKTDYKKIEIANFTATDASGTDEITYKVEVKRNNTTDAKVTDIEGNTENIFGTGVRLFFTPIANDGDGTYNIKYTATDKYGNTTTKSYSVVLGDIEDPEIVFAEDGLASNKQTETVKLDKNGKYVYTINLNDITATDDSDRFDEENAVGGDDESQKDNFKVVSYKLTKSGSSSAIEGTDNGDGVVTFNLTEAGTYTIKYSVTDYAGNTGSESFTFTVEANEGKKTFNSVALGVSLTVVALVGLGIAVFFALKDPKNKDKQKKNDKKDDEGKIVV